MCTLSYTHCCSICTKVRSKVRHMFPMHCTHCTEVCTSTRYRFVRWTSANWRPCMFFFVVTADAHTTPLVTQGCLFLVSHDTGWKLCPPSWCHLLVSFTPHTQLRVLRGCSAPPTISPLTTRSGRKRKLQKPNTEVYVGRHLTLKLFVLTDVFHSPPHPLFLLSSAQSWPPECFHGYGLVLRCPSSLHHCQVSN